MSEAFLGRQPIVDRHQRLKAYEILYAEGPEDRGRLPSTRPTRQVVLKLRQVGWRVLADKQPLVLPWDGELDRDDLPRDLPPRRFILSIDRGVREVPGGMERLEAFRRSGFRVLLDDYRNLAGDADLVDFADFVRVPHEEAGRHRLDAHLRELRGSRATLIGGRLPDHETFERALRSGARLFDGEWLTRPNPGQGPELPQNHVLMLRLLAVLNDPDVELAGVEDLVRQDVALSYRLVRLVNSAAYGLRHRVDSIGQAVMMLGLHHLKTWVSMVAIAAVRKKPEDLMVRAMARAWACEELAEKIRYESPERLFTVGLFSVLDALLDRPMSEALDGLPLANAVWDALVFREGIEGGVLDAVLAHERGEFHEAVLDGLEPHEITEAFLSALVRTDEALSLLS